MSESKFVYVNYIKTTPEKLWEALTSREFMAQYWLGNCLYAQRDYKASTTVLQGVVNNYPTHPRAPEALLAIAQNQIEQGQKAAARKTLQQIIAQYANTEAAQTAQGKLSQVR